MIDTLFYCLERAIPPATTFADSTLLRDGDEYGAVTLHRPSNVDSPDTLRSLLETLVECSHELPLFFPIHPRTRNNIKKYGLSELLTRGSIVTSGPIGYLEQLGLMKSAKMVLTDSGGIQEETTALGVPCITMRESTERPITAEQGTNTIVGTDPVKIRRVFDDIMQHGGKTGQSPELWDGKAAQRIARHIAQWWRDRN